MLPVILLANIFAGIWLNLSFWYKRPAKKKYAIWITGTGLVFTLGLNLALTPSWGISSRARPAGLRNRHGRCQLLPEPETLSRPVRLAPDRDLLPVGGAIYGTSLLTSALPAALEYTLNLAMLAAFRTLCDPSRKIDMKGITLDHQTLTI